MPKISAAIIGAGPAGLGLALALARRDAADEIVVFEKVEDHDTAPRYNPDRSYTIDITGHGVRALEYLDVTHRFDEELIKFRGIRAVSIGKEEPWDGPGWTGSRGDICRTLMAECKEKHPGKVKFLFETNAEVVDIYNGTVAVKCENGKVTKRDYDIVVACDGAGSTARRAMEEVPGFEQKKVHVNNFCTMVHFDQNTDELDPEWLYCFTVNPFVVGGAINGDKGPKDPKWFCMVGFDHEKKFKDAAEAREFLKRKTPKILRYISDKELEDFCKRTCSHIGRATTCNTFHAGRLVLLGDAGNPFPPVGQGINAALESAMVLDQCLAKAEAAGRDPRDALAAFTKEWLPEAHAVSWIAQRVEFGNMYKMGLVIASSLAKICVLTDAKKSTIKWSEIMAAAKARRAAAARVGYIAIGAAGLAASIYAGFLLGRSS